MISRTKKKFMLPGSVPPVFRSVGTSGLPDGSGGYTGLGMPSGWAIGDMLILNILAETASVPTITTPSGWTLITTATYNGGSAGRLSSFSRVAQSGDTAPTIAVSNNGDGGKAVIMAFKGASSVEAGAGATLSASSTAQPYDTITTLGPSRLVVETFSVNGNATKLGATPGAGWTNRFDRTDSASDDTTGNRQVLSCDTLPMATAGAVTAANRTYGSSVVGTNSCRTAFALTP